MRLDTRGDMLHRRRLTPTADERRRERHAAEMRRYRERDGAGIKIALAPYDQLIVRYLRWLGPLDEACADDRRAIGEAYYAALLESARDAQRKGYI
jgi:hypothetical protein